MASGFAFLPGHFSQPKGMQARRGSGAVNRGPRAVSMQIDNQLCGLRQSPDPPCAQTLRGGAGFLPTIRLVQDFCRGRSVGGVRTSPREPRGFVSFGCLLRPGGFAQTCPVLCEGQHSPVDFRTHPGQPRPWDQRDSSLAGGWPFRPQALRHRRCRRPPVTFLKPHRAMTVPPRTFPSTSQLFVGRPPQIPLTRSPAVPHTSHPVGRQPQLPP